MAPAMPAPSSPSEQKQNSGSSWLWQRRSTLAVVFTFATFIVFGLWVADTQGLTTAAAPQSGRKTAMHLWKSACTAAQPKTTAELSSSRSQPQTSAQQSAAPATPITAAQQVSGAACWASTKYLPSNLEQAWLANAGKWERDFCNNMAAHSSAVKTWVDTLKEHTFLQGKHKTADKSPAEALAAQQKIDPKVFSRFVTTYDCTGQQPREHVTWIEPVSHGLRHPDALCKRGADVMDRSYLLLSHRAEYEAAKQLGNIQCKNRACQTIYFDLGATTLQQGTAEAGQGWFFDAYRRQGFEFDRFLLWEAVPNPQPANIFKNVPKCDMHKYQYFNIPVTSDTEDPSNPVNILKTIAQPGDFVIFKLDIDNYGVEHAILNALVADPQALALVDEFFFEEHVAFKEMLPYWGNTVGPNTSLATSYALFHSLRQKGLRAHSWV